jgi:hypothetical protein
MSEDQNETRIHIDSDWKAEAEREKQKLLEEERKAGPGGTATDPAFVDMLNLLAMQAAISVGGYQGPGGESVPPDLTAARHQIAMLESLKRKTSGNLSDEERHAFDDLLHRLRMQYVKVAEAMDAGGPGGGGAAGPHGA